MSEEESTDTTGNSMDSSGITISVVRIRNFRCLREIEVLLTPMTILIGENNSGKTSFLEAIYAAIGSGSTHLSEDDIFLGQGEAKPPRDRDVTIDLLIRPVSDDGSVCESFPEGSPWLELWGNGIAQDDDDNDFVGMRMTMSWDRIKGQYSVQRRFLREWKPALAQMMEAEIAERVAPVTTIHIAPIALYLLDAKRDAAEEMHAKGSIWHKLIADHGLSDEDVVQIEQQLNDINSLMVQKSGVLTHIQSHLNNVSDVVSCDKDKIAVNPVARRLRDLNRGMDVVLATQGAPQFSMSRQGMGTRSLASVLLFRAYMTWRQQNQSGEALLPFVAIEEPESHLHPQAQRSLFRQLDKLTGLRIISTHSPFVCSQADITSFVHFFKDSNATTVSRFQAPSDPPLDPESVRAINRRVLNTRGELLFSRCVILFEGETEEQALPHFAEMFWAKHPNDIGVSFIGVGGSGNYLPFLRLTTKFRIPWVILSDGEESAVSAVNTALNQVGEASADTNPRCVVLPDSQCFEQYLINLTSIAALREMIASYRIESGNVSDQRGITGIKSTWSNKTEAEVLGELLAHKTTYGARIAQAYGTITETEDRVPAKLKEAFQLAYPQAAGATEQEVGNGN